jgi:hypothetical protein
VEEYWIPALLLGEAIVGVVLHAFDKRRCRAMIEQWAQEEGHQIVSMERCSFTMKPFFWHSSLGIYRVSIREVGGNMRSATVRCGSAPWRWPAGPIEVRWDDEANVAAGSRTPAS